jgi:hypothetical protein
MVAWTVENLAAEKAAKWEYLTVASKAGSMAAYLVDPMVAC